MLKMLVTLDPEAVEVVVVDIVVLPYVPVIVQFTNKNIKLQFFLAHPV